MSEMSMPEGVLGGGWNFVIAAYGLTAVFLAGYAWSLISRARAVDKDRENQP